ncbi:MAG: BrnT family toxin [Caldilineaceae bacterium]
MYGEIYDATGFDWDENNLDKNWYLHDVTNGECEEIFFNVPLVLSSDKTHSTQEMRYYALGRTDTNRWLFVAFTLRNGLIRIISARDMNQKEARKYENHSRGHSRF